MRYELAKGSHASRSAGMCAMEWVSFLAGEPHSDAPKCVAHDLQDFFIALNDRMDNKERQLLRPYLARTIGTREDSYGYKKGSPGWEYRKSIYQEILLEFTAHKLEDYDEETLAECAAGTMFHRVGPWTETFKAYLEKLLPTLKVDIESLTPEARPILQAA